MKIDVTYRLSSGMQQVCTIEDNMINSFIEAFKTDANFIYFEGVQTKGIKMKDVVSFTLSQEYIVETTEPSEPEKEPVFVRTLEDYSRGIEEHKAKKESGNLKVIKYRIECKCGVDYLEDHPFFRSKHGCKFCGKIVFTDKTKGLLDLGEGVSGYLMSNRYVVPR